MIGRSHASTEFTCEIRVLIIALIDFLFLLAEKVGAYRCA